MDVPLRPLVERDGDAMNEILCVGAGRGGHGLLQRLAARGLRQLAILDDDMIEVANLPNLRLGDGWVGWPKAQELSHALAARHGATVRWGNVQFSPELLAERSPFADMIYRQRLILAVTDDLRSQLALGVAAAKLEIPLIAVRVFANGGGDVYAQLDVEREPCLACFTAHLRRSGAPSEPLRGRDLPVGAGDRVDDYAADVALALLGESVEARRRAFAPHPRRGMPCAWEVGAERGEPTPIFFDPDPGCPICGGARGDLTNARRRSATRPRAGTRAW